MLVLKNEYSWKAVTCGKLRSPLRSQQKVINLKHNLFEMGLRGYFTAEKIKIFTQQSLSTAISFPEIAIVFPKTAIVYS
jgi:hypothetical protein